MTSESGFMSSERDEPFEALDSDDIAVELTPEHPARISAQAQSTVSVGKSRFKNIRVVR